MADQMRDCFGIADPDFEDQSIGARTNQQLPLTDGARASPWRTITGIEAVIIAASTMPNNRTSLYFSIRSRVLLADGGVLVVDRLNGHLATFATPWGLFNPNRPGKP